MKKLLSILGISLISIMSCSVVSCYQQMTHIDLPPVIRPKKIIKNLEYFQKQNQLILDEVSDYEKLIQELIQQKEEFQTQQDFQDELNQLRAQYLIKQAEKEECNYQIFILQNKNELNNQQKEQVIQILKNKLEKLENALILLNEIRNDDFNQQDINKVNEAIKETTKLLI
jgi:UDP-glucose 6-dehydrogenase